MSKKKRKHAHCDPTVCVPYLRAQGYTDIKDDECCVCYFQSKMDLSSAVAIPPWRPASADKLESNG